MRLRLQALFAGSETPLAKGGARLNQRRRGSDLTRGREGAT